MANSLSTSFIASFDTMVHQAFQEGSKLRGTVREKTGIKGSTHRFDVIGKKDAVLRGTASSDLVPLEFVHTNKTLTLEDYVVPDYADIYNLGKIAFDEKAELTKGIGMALGRRVDTTILGALGAATAGTTIA